jgi:hypothetical protein
LSALRAGRPPFTPRKIPGTHFYQRLSRPQGHSAAGRITSIEKSNYLIGKRTRYFPACSIVPQPTTLPRSPRVFRIEEYFVSRNTFNFRYTIVYIPYIFFFHFDIVPKIQGGGGGKCLNVVIILWAIQLIFGPSQPVSCKRGNSSFHPIIFCYSTHGLRHGIIENALGV